MQGLLHMCKGIIILCNNFIHVAGTLTTRTRASSRFMLCLCLLHVIVFVFSTPLSLSSPCHRMVPSVHMAATSVDLYHPRHGTSVDLHHPRHGKVNTSSSNSHTTRGPMHHHLLHGYMQGLFKGTCKGIVGFTKLHIISKGLPRHLLHARASTPEAWLPWPSSGINLGALWPLQGLPYHLGYRSYGRVLSSSCCQGCHQWQSINI